ncbi:MAG: Fic family protein [Bacteroidia bacterium]
MNYFQEIETLKQQIEELRPLKPETEQRILQKFRLDWNYHSNHIEGNKLTYGETKTFLLHGITAGGKPLKDHLDIKGHNEAILLLEDIIKKEREITETFIRELHSMILKEPYDKPSVNSLGQFVPRKIEIGKYKTVPNHVKTTTGEIFYFATPEETPAKMYDLMQWYRKMKADWQEKQEYEHHPLLIAALFHYKFIRIHPFDDGNGRLARILMNLILMHNGFPPVIIKTEKKEDYYSALRQADGGDLEYFVKYIGEQLIHSLNLYLRGAKGENIEDETDVDKEIALLKASLSGEKEKVMITKELWNEIYFKSIKPLFEKVLCKLNQFDELFFEKDLLFLFGTSVLNHARNLQDLEEKIANNGESIRSLVLEYRLREFKKTENLNFYCFADLNITLNQYATFKVNTKANSFRELTIPYHNFDLMNKYEDEIANALAKEMLRQIKEKLSNEN